MSVGVSVNHGCCTKDFVNVFVFCDFKGKAKMGTIDGRIRFGLVSCACFFSSVEEIKE